MIKDYSNYRGDTSRMIEFTDKAPENVRGRRLPIFNSTGIEIRFDFKIDAGTLRVIPAGEPEYAESEWPTANDLVAAGVVKEWHPYREADLWDAEKNGFMHSNGRPSIRKIKEFFRNAGFEISTEAIMHNYRAWRADRKSGYIDEANGIHVFSPCGCNPFNLHVTELNGLCEDWQTTYTY